MERIDNSSFEKIASNEGKKREGLSSIQISSPKSAYLYAIRLLTKNDYSVHSLTQKLLKRKYELSHIQEAIIELKNKNFLREDHLTENKIIRLMEKNFSPEYILKKLESEKLKADLDKITEVFWEHKVTEKEQVKNLLEKKLRNLTSLSDKDKNRAISHVLSKGHNLSLAKECIASYMSESEDY